MLQILTDCRAFGCLHLLSFCMFAGGASTRAAFTHPVSGHSPTYWAFIRHRSIYLPTAGLSSNECSGCYVLQIQEPQPLTAKNSGQLYMLRFDHTDDPAYHGWYLSRSLHMADFSEDDIVLCTGVNRDQEPQTFPNQLHYFEDPEPLPVHVTSYSSWLEHELNSYRINNMSLENSNRKLETERTRLSKVLEETCGLKPLGKGKGGGDRKGGKVQALLAESDAESAGSKSGKFPGKQRSYPPPRAVKLTAASGHC